MQLVVARDPQIASLPRRTAVASIDAVIAIVGGGATAIAGFALLKRFGRTPGWWSETGFDPGWAKRWNAPIRGVFAGLAVAGRNWRSPGMRIAGLRRVDARTGGPVTPRSAVVRAVLDALVTQLGQAHNRPILERSAANRLAADDEIERMRESRPDADPEELVRDSWEIRRRHLSDPGALTRRTVAHVVAIPLTACASRRRQTVTERLAGTIVINDR